MFFSNILIWLKLSKLGSWSLNLPYVVARKAMVRKTCLILLLLTRNLWLCLYTNLNFISNLTNKEACFFSCRFFMLYLDHAIHYSWEITQLSVTKWSLIDIVLVSQIRWKKKKTTKHILEYQELRKTHSVYI